VGTIRTFDRNGAPFRLRLYSHGGGVQADAGKREKSASDKD